MASTFTVERSTTIAAPPETVYAQVVDFHNWRSWSPWEEVDPDLQREYSGAQSGTGARYAWSGNKKAGVGSMEIVEATAPSKVAIDLRFQKPFKARNDTTFTITPEGEGSRVDWTMTGPLPFMMKLFTMFKSMDTLVGPDFEKGLDKLKQVSEGRG